MHRELWKKVENHPLRYVLNSVVVDPRDLPTKSELRAAIVEACPEGTDSKVIEALFERACDTAAKSVDVGARFDLRGEMNRLAGYVIEQWEAAEQIVPTHEEQIDAAAIATSVVEPDNFAEKAALAVERATPDAEMNW